MKIINSLYPIHPFDVHPFPFNDVASFIIHFDPFDVAYFIIHFDPFVTPLLPPTIHLQSFSLVQTLHHDSFYYQYGSGVADQTLPFVLFISDNGLILIFHIGNMSGSSCILVFYFYFYLTTSHQL